MATSINKTWRLAGGGTWATASNWANEDGSTSTTAPGTTAVVTINGIGAGTITVAAQTIGSLIINDTTQFVGSGLTVTNDVTINGGTLTHSGTGSLSVGRNFTNYGVFNQVQTTSGALTFNGAQAATVDLGTNTTRSVVIAKTSNTLAGAITLNGYVSCELTATTASGFTFTSGYLIQNATIYTRALGNSSTTARTWDQKAEIIVTLPVAGTAISAAQTTCTYITRSYIRLATGNTSGTITATFGAGAPSTCPNLVLDNSTIYAISGSLWEFWPTNGSQTATATITVFSQLNSTYTGGPWTAVTIQLVSSSTAVGNYVDCAVRFGTITCPGAWTSGTTYTGGQSYVNFVNVTCNSLNLNGIQASYILNGGTVYTGISFSTTSASTGSTLDINGGTTVALTLVTNANNTTNLKAGNTFSATGLTTFNTGALNLFGNLNTVSFTSSGTAARTFDWKNGKQIVTSGAGTLNLVLSSNCLIIYDTNIGGFYHGGTGVATGAATAWDGTPKIKTWAAATTAWSSWYTNDLEIVDGAQVGSASTINFTRNFTGYTSLNMASLTVNTAFADVFTATSTVTYSGAAIAAFTHALTGVNADIKQLTATNITLSGANTTYNLGVTGTSSMSLLNTGTIALSGSGSTYNLNYVTGYNLTLSSSTGTYNCYYYDHNYYTNPPTAGTVTHTAGTLILKANTNNFSMSTWAFTSNTGTRGITFENQGYIVTLNTGALNVNYTSLTSVCPDADTNGFYHSSSGAWQIGPNAPATPAAAFNICWTARATIAATNYVKNLGNWVQRGDGYRFGGGLLNNTAAITINVSGDILFTGNAFSSGVVQSDSKWQWLNLTYWGTDATRTSKYTTGYSEFGEGGIWRAFGPLTLASTFTGTLRLYQTLQVSTVTHDGGTLDVNGQQLSVTTSYNNTSSAAKAITNTAATSTYPDIYIAATSGTPWNFQYASTLTSSYKIWVYIRGGYVSHGLSSTRIINQPSFDLSENAGTWGTLTPTNNFCVGSLKIRGFTPANVAQWHIGGSEFTVDTTGSGVLPTNFTVHIEDGGNSKPLTQLNFIGYNFWQWPTFIFNTSAKLNYGPQFKNVAINANATVTSPGQYVYVLGTLSGVYNASGGNITSAILDVTGSTWEFQGASAITNDYIGATEFTVKSNDLTGTLKFTGPGGNQTGNQTATFANGYLGKILNNISYNSSTGVGVLTIGTSQGYSAIYGNTTTLIGQLDFAYNTAKIAFAGFYDPIRVVGSKFNLGTSATKYLTGAIYNVESTTVTADYLNLTDCPVSGGNGWYYGNNSTLTGNNSGWTSGAPPTYSLSRSASTVNEGSSVTITLTTTNIGTGSLVPYTITGITSADISGASLTDNFTIATGGTAAVVLNIAADYLTEGNETFTLSLNNGAGSISVTIIDTTLTPTYSLTRSAVSVTEGDSFTITLNTTNLPNGFTVPYTITGVDRSDINNASLTGNFTISSNTASLVIVTTWDYVTEGQEVLTLTLNPTYGTGSAISVAINNKLHPTYALSVSPTVVTEGGNFTVTLNTTDVPNGTTVPYTITGITSTDINGASLTDNFTISSNSASVIFTTSADYLTEGTETFRLTLDTIGTFVEINILDYYKTRTYALSTSATTVTEGDSFTITLTTTNVFDGTTVPYTISGTGITSADINNASLTGNFTITGGSGTQTFTTTIDGVAEGTETFTLSLGSPASGSINVSINDPVVAGAKGNFLSFFD